MYFLSRKFLDAHDACSLKIQNIETTNVAFLIMNTSVSLLGVKLFPFPFSFLFHIAKIDQDTSKITAPSSKFCGGYPIMVSKFCNVSLKRQRPFPNSTRKVTQEPSEVPLVESNDSGPSLIDHNRQKPLHFQGSSSSDEMVLKSRLNRLWLTPRPIIASMLNNKGVIFMEKGRE